MYDDPDSPVLKQCKVAFKHLFLLNLIMRALSLQMGGCAPSPPLPLPKPLASWAVQACVKAYESFF